MIILIKLYIVRNIGRYCVVMIKGIYDLIVLKLNIKLTKFNIIRIKLRIKLKNKLRIKMNIKMTMKMK